MSAMKFTSGSKHRFKSGDLYLGSGGFFAPSVGIKTERHGITIAGAGSGKGACIIIPNLLRWPSNILIIDPKGEAAEETAEAREKMGIPSYVLDPFSSSKVDPKFIASFNPLQELDPNSLTIKEDIGTISDGIIMRADPSASHWDDGAQILLSGLIAYAILCLKPHEINLIKVREILRTDENLAAALSEMQGLTGCGGLCQSAFGMWSAKEGEYFVSNARRNTEWLDSAGMKNTLSESSFSLSDLKNGRASVYLVLPANYLSQHGQFLRLFVRCALEEMARKTKGGELRGQQCLFLLDEFFSLGYIDEIAKAAGLMRGYGLQLWPILQDLGQLEKLYGRDGMETFFGNSDCITFFGNTDQTTLEYISRLIGERTEPEAFGMNQRLVGKALMSPQAIRGHVSKGVNDIVAKKMIVFAQGQDILSVTPRPYFK